MRKNDNSRAFCCRINILWITSIHVLEFCLLTLYIYKVKPIIVPKMEFVMWLSFPSHPTNIHLLTISGI